MRRTLNFLEKERGMSGRGKDKEIFLGGWGNRVGWVNKHLRVGKEAFERG